MSKLEVFFDYTCPFCFKGHGYLMELLQKYPDIEIEWRSCEAHPRPETYGRHSDLCVRAMYFALTHRADLAEYHRVMFQAAFTDRADIEDINTIVKITKGLLEEDELRSALEGNQFEDKLLENNLLAWEVYRFPAVPSYRLDGKILESKEGVGVSKTQLDDFLDS